MDINIEMIFRDIYNWIAGFLPHLFAALLVLLVGYIVAKILQSIVQKVLSVVKFDSIMASTPAGSMVKRVFESPTSFTAKLVFWLVFLGALSISLEKLEIAGLDSVLASVYGYMPHIVASVVIFLVASAISGAVVRLVKRVLGDSAMASTASSVAPALIMSISVFMILNELMIAPEIVSITYTAIIGAVALGLALAFGLGGKEVASKLLEQAYESSKKAVKETKKTKK
ncbi:transporter [Candidatus Saccharibacteria bacterium]|nr:MAG: transporter [Candidatus Saccharibacteria bacterium]